jgi:hypothetical protein
MTAGGGGLVARGPLLFGPGSARAAWSLGWVCLFGGGGWPGLSQSDYGRVPSTFRCFDPNAGAGCNGNLARRVSPANVRPECRKSVARIRASFPLARRGAGAEPGMSESSPVLRSRHRSPSAWNGAFAPSMARSGRLLVLSPLPSCHDQNITIIDNCILTNDVSLLD